jgi:SecD/SecF fusion protein
MRTSRWVVATYAAIILFGIVAALPNLLTPPQLDALPDWLPKQQVTLGLDLRGGSHLVLEVDAEALKASRLEALLEDAGTRLRAENIRPGSIRRDGEAIVVPIADPAERSRALLVLRDLATSVGATALAAGTPDLDVRGKGDTILVLLTAAGLLDRVNAAVEQSLEIVRQRVDQAGVAEPTIQRVGADRILVQLPGLQDPTRLRQLLGSTAQSL